MQTNSTTDMQTNSTTNMQTNSTTNMQTNSTTNMQTNSTTNMQTNSTTNMQTNSTTNMQTNSTTNMQTNSTPNMQTNSTTNMQTNSATNMQTNSTTNMQTNSTPNMQTNSATNMQTNSTTNMQTNSTTNMQTNSEVTEMSDFGSPVRAKRKPGRPASFSPSERTQRRKEKFKSRILLLDTFAEWRDLQKKLHLKSDRELARLLLDRYSSSNQSTCKTLTLERGLLSTWNSIMAAEGFIDDIEFLWFLLSLAVEKSSQGLPGVRSETSIVPGQGGAHKTSQKQTSSDKCVPVKVDYVGPRPMAASRSDQSNTTYNPTLTKNSKSAVTGPLASDRNVPEEAGYGRPNNISSETDSASEPELDCEGRLVKKEHEVDTDNEQEITYDDTDDEQEINLDNHDNTNLTSQLSSGTVGSDIKKEGELLETDLGNCMKTSTSQQSFGTVGTEDDPDWDLDDGDNTNLAGSEAEEEIVPVYRDDFEESEAEFSRSEDDEQGHKSDDSWHLPSERKKIKVAKESSESITSTSNSNESSCERESKPKKPWVCKCGEIFDTQSLYYKHKVEAHPKICEICNERFPTMNALNVCRRTHMSDEEKANLSERDSLAFCDLCRGFFSRRKLKKHIKLAHVGQQVHFYVDTWQDNTRQRDGQLKEDKPVIKRRRRRKLEVPKKCEPVPCTWEGCEKTFTRRNTMTAHLLSHTGERSHLCSYCGQMFLRQDHLKVHLRIHTGDMPFKCHLCSYSGRQSNCLKSHMKTHHPEYCQEAGDGRGAEPTQDMDTESEVLETSEQCSSPPGISFRPLNLV